MTLNTLRLEDIDEKIRLNQKADISMEKLLEENEKELKDFCWLKIRAEVHCQSLTEQNEHIRKRMEQIKANGLTVNPFTFDDYKERIAQLK